MIGAAWEALKSVAVNAFNALVSWATLLPSMLLCRARNRPERADLEGRRVDTGDLGWRGQHLNSTLTWIGGLSADALEWIGDTSSTLLDKGGDLLNGLLNGAVSTWETISTWLASIHPKLSTLWAMSRRHCSKRTRPVHGLL